MDFEVRTKKGTIRRGNLVVTEEWTQVAGRSLAGLADHPNVEVREVSHAVEENAPAGDSSGNNGVGTPDSNGDAATPQEAEEEPETAEATEDTAPTAEAVEEPSERPTERPAARSRRGKSG